jgi:hypothetical protein
MPISLSLALIILQENAGQVQLDSITCGGANRDFIIACLVIAAALALLGLLLKTILDKRLVWTSAWRLIITLLLVFVIGSALVAWNPTRTETWLNCISDPEYSRFMLMGTLSAIVRGIVMGGFLSSAIFFFLVIIVSIIRRMRKG